MNVGETYTDNWDPANAQNEMAQFLTKNNNKIDIAFVENDGMAGGVIAALKSQGLAGTVPVSGQDGDAAALNRVALGTQTVDVWKDARLLGDAAGAGCRSALRRARRWTRSPRRKTVRQDLRLAGQQQPQLDPHHASGDHQGQPPGRPRRQVDRQGHALQGRDRRLRRGLLTSSRQSSSQSRALHPGSAVQGAYYETAKASLIQVAIERLTMTQVTGDAEATADLSRRGRAAIEAASGAGVQGRPDPAPGRWRSTSGWPA